MRDQYVAASRPPVTWDAPPLPLALAHIMDWFEELSFARGSSGFSMNPLTYREIDAWARLTGRCPTPFDVRLLREVDLIYLASLAEEAAARRANPRKG